MANSYSVFSPEMIDALKRAALRGVKIKILVDINLKKRERY